MSIPSCGLAAASKCAPPSGASVLQTASIPPSAPLPAIGVITVAGAAGTTSGEASVSACAEVTNTYVAKTEKTAYLNDQEAGIAHILLNPWIGTN
ncbi:hypothetical protein [Kerstersia gyiorum]|uniref:hypothetical protein n=1 Tax=Kerstersia gyiorum TaxID=206506 RepID=UPI0030CFB9A0